MMFDPRPKSLGKDNFLKIGDKEEVTGIFRGSIYKFKRHWVESTNRSQDCTGKDCVACKTESKGPAFRFRVNFAVIKGDQVLPRIFEGSGETYDNLTTLDKKVDLSKTPIEITRTGAKQSTRYTFFPLHNMPLTKELEAAIKTLPLLPLSVESNEQVAAASPTVVVQEDASFNVNDFESPAQSKASNNKR